MTRAEWPCCWAASAPGWRQATRSSGGPTARQKRCPDLPPILDKVNYIVKLGRDGRDGRDPLPPARSRRTALQPLLHEADRPAARAPAAEPLLPHRSPRAL